MSPMKNNQRTEPALALNRYCQLLKTHLTFMELFRLQRRKNHNKIKFCFSKNIS